MAVRALLMRFGFIAHPGFKSPSLRHDLRFCGSHSARAAGFLASEARLVTPRSRGLLPGPSAPVRLRPDLVRSCPAGSQVEHRRDLFGGLAVDRVVDVDVAVLGESRGRVTGPSEDDFRRDPGEQRERDRHMAQVVEPGHRHPCMAAQCPEVPAYVFRVERRAVGVDVERFRVRPTRVRHYPFRLLLASAPSYG